MPHWQTYNNIFHSSALGKKKHRTNKDGYEEQKTSQKMPAQ
jgi:hypothetical protein